MAESKWSVKGVPIDDSDGLVSYMVEHTPRIRASDVRVIPSGTALPSCYLKDAERIYNMDVRPDDTWVITFPKCGTTWTQEMVYLIKTNCNFEKAKQIELDLRFPFLESDFLVLLDPIDTHDQPLMTQVDVTGNRLNSIGGEVRYHKCTIELIADMESPRFIKSHLPMELLPYKLWTVKPKIIYVCRNPAAAALSYYHHFTLINGYDGDLKHFLDAFLKDQIDFGPIWTHFINFWKLKNDNNILYITFEDMKDDLLSIIKKTADFLNVKLTPEQENQLEKHLNISNMKDNPSVNKSRVINKIKGDKASDFAFIRKGEKDEWKHKLPPDYIEKFEQWNQAHKKNIDFPYY